MNEIKNERPAVNEASEDHLRRSNPNSLTRIGHSVEKQLDETLWRLIAGDIGLDACTPAIVGLWSTAYDQGRASLRGRLDRLEWERDLYYWLTSNKGKSAADYYSHQTSELWRMGVES